MTDFKSQKIKQALKDLLKKKGLTYEELANELECSVPTIKRILGPEELTLTRLLEIADVLKITLAELDDLTSDLSTRDEKFSPEQEQFLAKNPAYLAYLMKLFSGETPKEIAQKNDLNARSTDKYLIALEKHELIRVTGKLKVKPAFKSVPSFGEGPLGNLYFESLIQSSAKFFVETAKDSIRSKARASDADRPKALWGIHGCKVTKASYERWVQEQEKARRDFERLATFEEKTKPAEELMTAVVVGAHTLVKNEYPNLEVLENLFGPIRNL